MKKILTLVVLATLFLVGCGGNTEKTYVVGTNAEFPPFEYMEGDKIVGFDIELIELLSKEAGIKYEIKDMSFDGLLPALQTKKIDLVVSGMTATEERKKTVNFTKSYYSTSQVIIVREDENNIKSFDDLKGKKAGVMLGFTGDLIVSDIEGVNVKKYNASYAAILDLKANKIDAVVLDSEPAKNYVKQNKGIKVIEGVSVTEEYAIALRKEDKELLEKLNKAFDTIKSNGEYKKLYDKYFNK
ncbi:MAG: arginine/lysine/histidine transporter system substrate-binding protein [Fusobacteriaceae bacterium]|jgi:polar amino acid transport system substrate-binding protein|nr:basic amino acid transporter substrate-binding protein [Fusobacteriales bacterium]MDN5305009.1 arginine/lysine/histidine transporter system substrate-binding protein [Fusobacteriaceae bacterium]